jgi:hypothetical protein
MSFITERIQGIGSGVRQKFNELLDTPIHGYVGDRDDPRLNQPRYEQQLGPTIQVPSTPRIPESEER